MDNYPFSLLDDKRNQRAPKPATALEQGMIFHLRALGMNDWHRDFYFSERQFNFDFAILSHQIAIECEGGLWRRGGGAHSTPKAIMRDMEKYNLAASLGWRVIRAHNNNKTHPACLSAVAAIVAGIVK